LQLSYELFTSITAIIQSKNHLFPMNNLKFLEGITIEEQAVLRNIIQRMLNNVDASGC